MTEIHITDPSIIEDDITIEKTLRPSHFDDFVGQNDVVDNLKLYIDAANKRDEALDHVLLFGPPGLGKTTLANIISKELNVNLKQSSGPVIDKAGDLAGMLTNISRKDVFFIDVLDAENELFQAQANLIKAESDLHIYVYSLLSSVGELNARSLQLPVASYYNPEEYYNKELDENGVCFGSKEMYQELNNYNSKCNFNEGIIFVYKLLRNNLSKMEYFPNKNHLTELELINHTVSKTPELRNISTLIIEAYKKYELARFRTITNSSDLNDMDNITRNMTKHNHYIINMVE